MLEYNTSTVIFNILGAEIGAPSLKIKDLIEIRSANNLSFSMKLQFILHKFYQNFNLIPVQFKEYFSTFENFLYYVSYYEIESIAYTYTLCTYETNDSYEKPIKCPICENNFKYDISLKEFISLKNIKIWNKNKPYFEYDFNFEYKIDNQTSIKFIMFIPNIYTYLIKVRGLTTETINYNIEKYGSILDIHTELTLHTKQIILTTDNDSNKNEILDKPDEIYELIVNLPANIYNQLLFFYQNNIKVYCPNYRYELKCPHCKNTILLSLSPLLEFINITEHKTKQESYLNEYISLFETLYTVSENHFTSFNEFINLPYPVFEKLSKTLIDSFKQKTKIQKQKMHQMQKIL